MPPPTIQIKKIKNSRYRKYKESAHVACLTSPISQPSLDISHIWIPFITNEVTNSQRSVGCDRFFMGSIRFQSRTFSFYSTEDASGRHEIVTQNFPINPMRYFSWTLFVS
jgi:hypothetical protein